MDDIATAARPLRVGLIGANPTRGWGRIAHIPALTALDEFELVAVATRHLDTARATAEAHGARFAFDDPAALAAHPEVDVVSVTVKVPYHLELVRLALDAGKHVYCEWPLGNSLPQARELARLAEEAGVRNVVGLQGMFQPWARYVGELVQEGRIGRPLGVSVVSHSMSAGQRTPSERMYSADPAAGDTALSVATGHIFGALSVAVGRPRELSGTVAAVNRRTTVVETGEVVDVTAPDQVVVLGRLDNDAALSIAVQGCVAPAMLGFEIRFIGSGGSLLVRSTDAGAVHIGEASVAFADLGGAIEELPIPDRFVPLPASIATGRPRNVALVYRELAAAIREGRPARNSFSTAVGFHEMLEAVQTSSDAGVRQTLSV